MYLRSKQGRQGVSKCGDDSEDDVVETDSLSNIPQRKKTLPFSSKALRDALILNTKKLVEVLDRIQDREDARHRELVHIYNIESLRERK